MRLLLAALFFDSSSLQRGLRCAEVLMYLSARHSTYVYVNPAGLFSRQRLLAGRPIRGRAYTCFTPFRVRPFALAEVLHT
jgi:hypothetical protein